MPADLQIFSFEEDEERQRETARKKSNSRDALKRKMSVSWNVILSLIHFHTQLSFFFLLSVSYDLWC